MTNYLTPEEWRKAAYMFQHGADTLKIAARLKCHEALIYNCLPVYREKYRSEAA